MLDNTLVVQTNRHKFNDVSKNYTLALKFSLIAKPLNVFYTILCFLKPLFKLRLINI